MDLTIWTTTTTTNTHSVPAPQNPYDHPQSTPLPNPNHLHLTSEPYTYHPPTQEHQIQQQHAPPPPSGYYQIPNWQYSQINAVHQLGNLHGVGVPSNWVQQYAAAIPNATTTLPSQAIQSYGIGNEKRKKVVHSASCDICKVVCTSKDVLEQHKLGKKHLKNVSKMVKLDTLVAVASNPMIGPAESPAKTKAGATKKSKRPASSQGDLETKRMKVVAGGASADAVRVCAACNVVCNSETVFNYHIAGQKHAASMKKYLALVAGKIN